MEANKWVISARKRPELFGISAPTDFELGRVESMDAHEVLTNPLISLYCLDHAHRCALFVETAPEVDLCAAPFMYLAQYENALNVISVPYETLYELADSIELDSRRLILVYSVGRSGSTLVGSALNAIPEVIGLSEPDTFCQLMGIRGWDGDNEAETIALLKACIKLQCKPTQQIPNPAAWAIKFRSFCIELADLLHTLFPDTKNVFLYRNAETQISSAKRAFVPAGVDPENVKLRSYFQNMGAYTNRDIAKYVRSGGSLLPMKTIGAMLWVRVMECYTDLINQGMPGMAVRYEDLKTRPREAAKAIVSYCGFPDAPMEPVYQVLEKDSQAGTALSQEALGEMNSGLAESRKTELAQFLATHASIKSADFVVPGTWQRAQ